jgi:sulfur carrier protein ThiS
MGPLFADFVRIQVEFRPRRQAAREVHMPAAATVGDVLRDVGESRDHTLVLRGSLPVTEDEPVQDGDVLVLVSAFSGG